MTDDLGWVALGVKPDASGFSSSLSRQVSPGMDAESRRIGSRFGAGFKKSVIAGAVGLTGALTGGVKLLGDSIGEARDAQKVGAQTAAVLKSTGSAAKVSEAQIGRYATRLSNMAGIDDELIQSGENVLLTFKGIRNEAGKGNEIFKRATKTALDMSVALGTDLKGSSIQVGKALNDPIKGITALQRVGVSFTNTQRAQIKALVEGGDANAAMAMNLIQTSTEWSTLLKANGGDSQKVAQILTQDLTPAQKKVYDTYAEGGHTLEAQKRILRELSSEFKGSARSQATEGDKLKVAFGNLEEEIGTALLPYMDDLAKFIRKEGIPAVKDFAGWVGEHGAPALKKLGGFAKDAAGVTKDLVGFLKDLPDPAKYAGLLALIGGVGAAKLRGGKGGLLGSTGSILGMTKPVNVFVTNPGFGSGGGAGGFTGGAGGKGVGSLPGFAPFIPIGVGGKIESTPLALPPEFKKNLKDYNRSWDDFGIHAMAAFHAVDLAIEHSTPLMVRYNRVLDGTPRQIKTWVGLSGYEKAIGQINTLKAGIDALASRGLDNGVPYLHGGVTYTGDIHVNTTDERGFQRDMNKRHRRKSLGGVG